MYKRLELHNHTTESDSSITCQELIELMVKDNADAFAITDHNTISGHGKIRSLLEDMGHPIDCIYGMEYTTYYGHILCLNLQEYVPWENINIHKPELLFRAAREKGALTGVAHPFSYGHPFARGCRFDMEITDFSALDFIEIFNNPEPLHDVNERGLLWWESLVLKGHRLAMTCGMDLHGIWDMGGQFATYIPGEKGGDTARELADAIHSQQTCISKGPILTGTVDQERKSIALSIQPSGKPGYLFASGTSFCLTLKTAAETIEKEIKPEETLYVPLSELKGAQIIIPKMYQLDTSIENLVCVGSVIYVTA